MLAVLLFGVCYPMVLSWRAEYRMRFKFLRKVGQDFIGGGGGLCLAHVCVYGNECYGRESFPDASLRRRVPPSVGPLVFSWHRRRVRAGAVASAQHPAPYWS